jgi:hypothetical protein
MLEDPPPQPVDVSRKGRATNTERIVLAVNPARAGTHGVARVTATNFNPILLTVKLRNISKKEFSKNQRATGI